MNGIVAYGVYLPCHRLDRKAIGEALGVPAGKGTRAVASYDEDTTSLAVEAPPLLPPRGPRLPQQAHRDADPRRSRPAADRGRLRHARLDPLRCGRAPAGVERI